MTGNGLLRPQAFDIRTRALRDAGRLLASRTWHPGDDAVVAVAERLLGVQGLAQHGLWVRNRSGARVQPCGPSLPYSIGSSGSVRTAPPGLRADLITPPPPSRQSAAPRHRRPA